MGMKIVTAARGEGKTSFVRAYVARAASLGRSVGGIASVAVFENNERTGYDLLDLHQGGRRPLARLAAAHDAEPTVGMFRFDEEAVAEGNAAVVAAVRDGRELIAIDEVGPLELGGRGWAAALQTALRECTAEQELVITVRPSLVDKLPERFPSPWWAGADHILPPWPAVPPQD